MTISTTTNRAQFSGSGTTGPFPFTYKVFDSGDLTVVRTSAGTDTTLTITTDYTVSLNADQNNDPGGEITLVSALAVGQTLTVLREVDASQETDITNGGGFYPEVIENALDKLTMLVQQNAEKISRALIAGVTEDPQAFIQSLYDAEANAAASEAAAAASASAADSSADAAAVSAASAGGKLPKDGSEAMTGNLQMGAGTSIVFEGTTDDANETTLSAGDPTADRAIVLPDMSGVVAVQVRGADVASASTINLTTATGDIVDVTGTTAITAITLADGLERQVRFTGALTLTNGASLILPGGANITTAAGDFAVFRGYASGVVRCVSYTKASGQAVVGAGGITLGTPVASTSGTSIDFTGIPAGVKRITVAMAGVSTNGSSNFLLQIGSGSILTSGYNSSASAGASGATSTSGSILAAITAAATIYNISVSLVLINAATNSWLITSVGGTDSSNAGNISGGRVSLAGALDRVRITTVGGTDTFDAGSINISYE